jgi:hypothetical protein
MAERKTAKLSSGYVRHLPSSFSISYVLKAFVPTCIFPHSPSSGRKAFGDLTTRRLRRFCDHDHSPTRIAWHRPTATRGWSCESFLSSRRWCSLLLPGQRQLLWQRRCNHRARSPTSGIRRGQDRSRLHNVKTTLRYFRRRDFAPKFWFNRPDPSGTPSPDTPTARTKRAYKLRQQPAETPTASAARGSFLWQSMARRQL